MSDEWFYQSGSAETGPVTFSGLRELAQRGQLKPGTLVRSGRTGAPVPASTVAGLFAAPKTGGVSSEQWHCRVNGQVYGPISPTDLTRWAKERRLSPSDSVKGPSGDWVLAATVPGLFPEAQAAAAVKAAEEAAIAAKNATSSSAEDIIRKMRPDLFGQKKHTLGGGESDDLKKAMSGGTTTATAVETEEKTKKAPAKFGKERKKEGGGLDIGFSLGSAFAAIRELPYSVVDAVRSGVNWFAAHTPYFFSKWGIPIAGVLAIVALGVGAYMVYARWPETNEDKYIYDALEGIYSEYRTRKSSNTIDDDWKADAVDQIDGMIADLENTSTVFTQIRQHLLWAAKDNLRPIVEGTATPKHEEDFKRHMSHVSYRWSDEERRQQFLNR